MKGESRGEKAELQKTASAFGWFFGMGFILSSLAPLLTGPAPFTRVIGLGVLIMGTIILPPVTGWLRSKLPFLRPPAVPTLIAIGLTGAVIVLNPFPAPTPAPTQEKASKPEVRKPARTVKTEQKSAETAALIAKASAELDKGASLLALQTLIGGAGAQAVKTDPAFKPLIARIRAALNKTWGETEGARTFEAAFLPPTSKNLNRKKMLAAAEAELRAGRGDRALGIIYDNSTTKMLRTDKKVRALRDTILAHLKAEELKTADPAGDFAYRVTTYWLPQIADIPTTGEVTEDEIRKRRVFLEEVVARDLKLSRNLAPSAELKKAQDQLVAALSAKQGALFPRWRRFYGEQLDRVLWERNIDVAAIGSGGRTIRFTGGLFASNANIAAMEEGAEEGFRMLRFSRAAYRWIPDGEGSAYKLDVPSDQEVGYWEGSKFVTAR